MYYVSNIFLIEIREPSRNPYAPDLIYLKKKIKQKEITKRPNLGKSGICARSIGGPLCDAFTRFPVPSGLCFPIYASHSPRLSP